jgi:hypothetical protein
MAGTLRAAVLGCGPAGLLAAHGIAQAARNNGVEAEVSIYSSKRKSPLFGCQYLHRSIPGLDLRYQAVDYRLTGTLEEYRKKVYGIEDVAVSPGILEDDHGAWDIRQAYDQLWDAFSPAIEDYFLTLGSWRLLRARLEEAGTDLVISTIPATVLCQGNVGSARCTFHSEQIWAMGDAPDLGRGIPEFMRQPPGTVLCNGEDGVPWYRISNVFGYHTAEWPEDHPAPRGASKVTKPIKTTCKCHPTLHRSGRYARWTKGVLAHESYEDGYRLANRLL